MSETATLVESITEPSVTPQTLRQALHLARLDLDRRLELHGHPPGLYRYLQAVVHRGGMAVLLYRLVDYAHVRGWRIAVKLGLLAMYHLGRAEVHPGALIGPGLVLPDMGGVGLPKFCTIGRNCTFLGPALLTVGGMEGIDLSTDRIVMGDNCVVGFNARIMGAITLGHGTQIKPGSVVMTSFPKEGCLLSGIPARRRTSASLDQIANWSPVRGAAIDPELIPTPAPSEET